MSLGRARAVLTVGLVIVVLAGVVLLREATMSTHYRTDRDSRLVVVVRVESNRAAPRVTMGELTTAQINTCALQVARTDRSPVEAVAGTDDRFSVTLQPALDSTDRKQYRGCLEDWTVDHLRLHVISMVDEVAS